MTNLHRKPTGTAGKVHDITPVSASWSYVGFGLYRLEAGETATEPTGEREAILVLVEGRAAFMAGGESLGELGDRMNVFERTKPWSVYVPNASSWSVQAATPCTLAVCTAPGEGGHEARVIGPDVVVEETRGTGANTRQIHSIALEQADVADHLLVTEVYTRPATGPLPASPARRGRLPEHHLSRGDLLSPRQSGQGFGIQRVFTEDGSLDETMSVADHDVVLVPKGHHPCGAPYGYELYYLNVMAGPLRKWRFKNHPDHEWVTRQ